VEFCPPGLDLLLVLVFLALLNYRGLFYFFVFFSFLCLFGRKSLNRGCKGGEPVVHVAGGKIW
jgi:hypothetical protein